MRRDLILSSGFLAFARHIGFLQAVEQAGVEIDAVSGTSSGALVGALWAAGMPAEEIAAELSAQRPIRLVRPSSRPWRGLFRAALIHWVERTRGTDAASKFNGLQVVETPPSGASFFGLGDFKTQVREAFALTSEVLSTCATSPGGASSGGAPELRDR